MAGGALIGSPVEIWSGKERCFMRPAAARLQLQACGSAELNFWLLFGECVRYPRGETTAIRRVAGVTGNGGTGECAGDCWWRWWNVGGDLLDWLLTVDCGRRRRTADGGGSGRRSSARGRL
ncbi:pectin lyase-like superfamily protein [Striga asiatica]|uniref:Pectin lyase-like superfamily protein n=1 Tax=Striga asiatica TaxID=4170 RepID=A0A5A7PVF7_STRAF|nr:pectin lyase-like superfamily protein [Striga asiatica]